MFLVNSSSLTKINTSKSIAHLMSQKQLGLLYQSCRRPQITTNILNGSIAHLMSQNKLVSSYQFSLSSFLPSILVAAVIQQVVTPVVVLLSYLTVPLSVPVVITPHLTPVVVSRTWDQCCIPVAGQVG
jgi:hypothetical protein